MKNIFGIHLWKNRTVRLCNGILLSIYFSFLSSISAQPASNDMVGLSKARPRYLTAGSATGLVKLRDTGTSPRYFSGLAAGASIGLYAEDSLRATYVNADFGLATLDDAGKIFIVQWQGPVISISAGTMWKLNIPQLGGLKLAVGPSVRSFTMLRSNDSFLNAGFGVDNVNSVGANIGLFFPFERKFASEKKILGLKIRSLPRKYNLSYLLHAPIVGYSAKPEYAYLTNVVGPDISSYDTYKWGLGGYMLHMESNFTYFLHNGNALRLRYAWSVLGVSDVFDLNVAQHTAGLIFMFRFNKMNRDERY